MRVVELVLLHVQGDEELLPDLAEEVGLLEEQPDLVFIQVVGRLELSAGAAAQGFHQLRAVEVDEARVIVGAQEDLREEHALSRLEAEAQIIEGLLQQLPGLLVGEGLDGQGAQLGQHAVVPGGRAGKAHHVVQPGQHVFEAPASGGLELVEALHRPGSCTPRSSPGTRRPRP